jgi:hypothetical protein
MSDAVAEARRVLAIPANEMDEFHILDLREALANLLALFGKDAEVERVCSRLINVDTDTHADREAVNEAATMLRAIAAENRELARGLSSLIIPMSDESIEYAWTVESPQTEVIAPPKTDTEVIASARDALNHAMAVYASYNADQPDSVAELADELRALDALFNRRTAPVTDEKRAELVRLLRTDAAAWKEHVAPYRWTAIIETAAADMLKADAALAEIAAAGYVGVPKEPT